MAKETVSTAAEESNTLYTKGEVRRNSLPRSLRHNSKADALEDAIFISKALNILFMALADGEWTEQKGANQGFSLLTDLLIDKIEIGAGLYDFPMLTSSDDAPALAKRIGGSYE